ncbi:(2Fe-2S) ferredoxin domain-containing protein [Pannus brasiliensis CCIBt3594]|uniref:(2Fe-2S) ferredoxin domain-containing protein n=1 Tax=Pannus brasiliensis CCIBt3594 TaxID=1427578 RepID=A0AAW9QWN6_9CHRO
MSKYSPRTLPFQVVGQFLGFVLKDGYKIKYLRIIVDGREYWFKPEKELRDRLSLNIPIHTSLQVTGESRVCEKTGKLKLKVTGIENLSAGESRVPEEPKPKPKQATVLVCQKSDCWKNGGATVCRMLEEGLQEKGLADTVHIKRTGCLKQCKRGPNVVVMPDKKHYSNVDPRQIPELIERHFASSEEAIATRA